MDYGRLNFTDNMKKNKKTILRVIVLSVLLIPIRIFAEDSGFRPSANGVKNENGSIRKNNIKPIKNLDDSWAILLLPKDRGPSIKKWIERMEKFPELRLNIALSLQDFEGLGDSKDRIMRLLQNGQIEIAVRLDGDPPLPLIYDLESLKTFLPSNLSLPMGKMTWQEDVTSQIIKVKMSCFNFTGEQPGGFVPGGGAISQPIAEFLKKQGWKWTVGNFPKEEWPLGEAFAYDDESGSIRIFSAHPAADFFYDPEIRISSSNIRAIFNQMFTSFEERSRPEQIPVIVFDEIHAQIPFEVFLDGLQSSPYRKRDLVLCSEAASLHEPPSSDTPQIWPYSWSWMKGIGSPRGPGLSTWIGDPVKNRLWELLIRTRQEIIRYRNSGAAELGKLDQIMEKFYGAESGSFFEWQGAAKDEWDRKFKPRSDRNETELKRILSGIYADLGMDAPKDLQNNGQRSAISAPTEISKSSGTTGSETTNGKPKIQVERENHTVSWIQTEEIPPPPEPEQEWGQIKNLSVSVSSDSRGEQISFSSFFNQKKSLLPVVQIYIDINQREGAGNSQLVHLRNAGVESREGWEFFLEGQFIPSKGWECKLYRANSAQPFYQAVISSQKESFFQARIPKNLLGRDPLRWGYLISIIKNNVALDFLSPLEHKKEVLEEMKNPSSNKQFNIPMLR